MAIEFKLPDIGEGVAEGEITRWLVKEGDSIGEDEPMVEVMTDKATVEITSPVTGKVQKILYPEGAVVPVHDVIVILDNGSASTPAAAPAASAPAPSTPPSASKPEKAAAAPAAKAAPAPAAKEASAPTADGPVLATPATRKLAREHGVELAEIPGWGPGGRVTKDDVAAFVESAPAPAVADPYPSEHKV